MAFLEIGGRRHAIPAGEVTIGSDASALIQLAGEGVAPRHAVLQGLPGGQVAIRLADEDMEVLVNGVRLGPQPTPLLHGDKVQIAGQELLFVEERQSGSTQYVQAMDPSMMEAAGRPAAQRKATAATGGRVVSLTDGREYTITGSLVIGRDASCDVVLTSKSVSRRHAEILASPKGYVVVDSSTNGTLVNGTRIQGQHLLARGDIIQCGEHEFRFYADLAPAAPPPAPAEAPKAAPGPPPTPVAAAPATTPTPPLQPTAAERAPTQPPPAPPAEPVPPPAAAPAKPVSPPPVRPAEPVPPPGPPPGAEHRLSNTLHGVPGVGLRRKVAEPVPPSKPKAPPSAEPRPSRGTGALANLLVRSGPLKGQRFPIRVPIVNLGRAEYNDIVLPDDSVSTTHAKLQRREGIWVLVDLESTNGTLVDGERVQGEVPLAPGALIRFGDVQTMFEPTDDTIDAPKGSSTRLISAVKPPGEPPAPEGPPPGPKMGGGAAGTGGAAPSEPKAQAAVAEPPTVPSPKVEPPPRAPSPDRPALRRPRTRPPQATSAAAIPKWIIGLFVVVIVLLLIAILGAG